MPAHTLVCFLYSKPENIEKVKAKLQEANQVYSKDKDTLAWLVMQDVKDPQAFTIVERFASEDSQKYHLENPYWKTFDPYIIPLLTKPIELHRHNEISTTNEVRVDQDSQLWEAIAKHQSS